MRTRRKTVLIMMAVALLGLAALYYFAGHKTAAGQPPLVHLNSATLHELRTAFNQSADANRMILLLSPT